LSPRVEGRERKRKAEVDTAERGKEGEDAPSSPCCKRKGEAITHGGSRKRKQKKRGTAKEALKKKKKKNDLPPPTGREKSGGGKRGRETNAKEEGTSFYWGARGGSLPHGRKKKKGSLFEGRGARARGKKKTHVAKGEGTPRSSAGVARRRGEKKGKDLTSSWKGGGKKKGRNFLPNLQHRRKDPQSMCKEGGRGLPSPSILISTSPSGKEKKIETTSLLTSLPYLAAIRPGKNKIWRREVLVERPDKKKRKGGRRRPRRGEEKGEGESPYLPEERKKKPFGE